MVNSVQLTIVVKQYKANQFIATYSQRRWLHYKIHCSPGNRTYLYKFNTIQINLREKTYRVTPFKITFTLSVP